MSSFSAGKENLFFTEEAKRLAPEQNAISALMRRRMRGEAVDAAFHVGTDYQQLRRGPGWISYEDSRYEGLGVNFHHYLTDPAPNNGMFLPSDFRYRVGINTRNKIVIYGICTDAPLREVVGDLPSTEPSAIDHIAMIYFLNGRGKYRKAMEIEEEWLSLLPGRGSARRVIGKVDSYRITVESDMISADAEILGPMLRKIKDVLQEDRRSLESRSR